VSGEVGSRQPRKVLGSNCLTHKRGRIGDRKFPQENDGIKQLWNGESAQIPIETVIIMSLNEVRKKLEIHGVERADPQSRRQ
jgi:hypothetical protein